MTTPTEFYQSFNGATARVLWHHSPEEYVEFLEQAPNIENMYGYPKPRGSRADSWAGDNWYDAIDKLRYGDDARAILAEKIFDQIIASDQITIGRSEIISSIVGPIPNVPALLAGQPETMLVRASTDNFSASAPVRIFIDVGVSGGVGVPELIKRGVAVLAFAMVMKQIRPIELYAINCYLPHGSGLRADGAKTAAINVVRIETSPLDLARAAWMLTDPGFCRRLAFNTSVYILNDIIRSTPNHQCRIAWGFSSDPTKDTYINKARKAIALEPQDIFIKGGYLYDQLMLDNPVEWVNKMIADNKALTEDN